MTRDQAEIRAATRNLDAALLACAAGDTAGLRDIYESEAPRLLGLACRIVGRRDLAEDVVHDAFLQIWQQARSFNPNRGSARGWIHTVVRNRAKKLRRAQLRHDAIDGRILREIFDFLDSSKDSAPDLSEECALRHHLARLDPRKRASLILSYVDGCTHREIADELGVPIGTAKAWIRRSLIVLRTDLGGTIGRAKGTKSCGRL